MSKTYLFWMDTTILGWSGCCPFLNNLAIFCWSGHHPLSSGRIPRGYHDCIPCGGSYFYVFFAIPQSRSRIFHDLRDRVILYVAIYTIAIFCWSRVRSPDHAGLNFYGSWVQFPGPDACFSQVNPWPMSLAPMIGGSGCFAEKIKPM